MNYDERMAHGLSNILYNMSQSCDRDKDPKLNNVLDSLKSMLEEYNSTHMNKIDIKDFRKTKEIK